VCYTCWEELGFPSIRNDKVDRAVKLLKALFKNHEGGRLEAELTDWNLDPVSIMKAANCEPCHLSRLAMAHLMTMEEEERASALAKVLEFKCKHNISVKTLACKVCGMSQADIEMERIGL
jgi:uncharacterized metal-binding protein